MRHQAKCIYCGRFVAMGRGEGDHVIPAALGEFRQDVRFRRICPGCNNAIGKSEAQVLRCSSVRLYRHVVLGSRARARRHIVGWRAGAEGMRPPKVVIFQRGQELLAEPRCDMEAVEPVDQLIVKDKDGNTHHIRLFPEMKPKSLKKKFDALGLRGQQVEMAFNWNDQHGAVYSALIQEVFGLPVTTSFSVEPGMHPAQVRFEFRVNTHYFRAVAKIALHYYLLHSRLASGREPAFRGIKRFIRWGEGATDVFFMPNRIFVVPAEMLFRNVTSSRWVHLLGACEHNGEAVAFVRMFYGPRSRGVEYHIRLGRLSSRVVLPNSAWSHSYLYDSPVPTSGLVGQVDPVPLTRVR